MDYLILPTTTKGRIVLMPICQTMIRPLSRTLSKLDEDSWSTTSITLRQIENDHTPNHTTLWVYNIYMLGQFTLANHGNHGRLQMGSIQTIHNLKEFADPSKIRAMVSSLWTFNSSTHPTHPDTFMIDEEDDKLNAETLAFGVLLQNSLLRDVINQNLNMLSLQPPQ